MLHEGHLDLFKKLKAVGDIAIVGVTPDVRVTARKGPGRPAQLETTRLSIVDAIKHVDYTFLSPTSAAGYRIIGYRTLEHLQPDYFLTSEDIWEEDRQWLATQDTELMVIPRFRDDISTTATINRIVAQNQSSLESI